MGDEKKKVAPTKPDENKGKPPYLIEASAKTSFRFGYKNGRCEVGVRIPILGIQWFEIEMEDLPITKECLEKAEEFAALPEEVRIRIGAD